MLRSQRKTRGGALTATTIETSAGVFVAHFSERGLAGLDFPRRYAPLPQTNASDFSPELREWIALTGRALAAALSGTALPSLPPLDLTSGTEFQQRVWTALRRIPLSQTKSYGEIAAEIGSPKAVRAVGGACGANPIPVLVPCHRVLAGAGKLGGFSAGLDWKLRLLAAEGVPSPGGPG